jgi:hypothetical protein
MVFMPLIEIDTKNQLKKSVLVQEYNSVTPQDDSQVFDGDDDKAIGRYLNTSNNRNSWPSRLPPITVANAVAPSNEATLLPLTDTEQAIGSSTTLDALALSSSAGHEAAHKPPRIVLNGLATHPRRDLIRARHGTPSDLLNDQSSTGTDTLRSSNIEQTPTSPSSLSSSPPPPTIPPTASTQSATVDDTTPTAGNTDAHVSSVATGNRLRLTSIGTLSRDADCNGCDDHDDDDDDDDDDEVIAIEKVVLVPESVAYPSVAVARARGNSISAPKTTAFLDAPLCNDERGRLNEPKAPRRLSSYDRHLTRHTISLSRMPSISVAETSRLYREAEEADRKKSWRVSIMCALLLMIATAAFAMALKYERFDGALAACLAFSGTLLWAASLLPARHLFMRQCYVAAAFSSCYICAIILSLHVMQSSDEEEATAGELGMIWFFVLLTLACFIGSLHTEAWFLAVVAIVGGLTAPFLLADYYNLIAMVVYSSCITGTGMVLYVYHARSACGQWYFHVLPFVVAITGWIVCFIQNMLVVTSVERHVVRAAIVSEWVQFWLIPLWVYFSCSEFEPAAAYTMELTVLFFTVASGGMACLLLSFTAYSFMYWSGWALVMGLLYAIASSVLEVNLNRPLIAWIHYGFALALTTISITMLFKGNTKHMLLAVEAFIITLLSATNERFLGLLGGLGIWAYVLFQSAYVLVFKQFNGIPLWNPDAVGNATVLAILSLQSHLMPNLSKVIFEAVVHAYLTMLLYHEFEFYPNLLYLGNALYPLILQFYAHYRFSSLRLVEQQRVRMSSSTFMSLGLNVHKTEFHIRIVYGYALWLWLIASQTLPRLLFLVPCDTATCIPILNSNALTSLAVPVIAVANSFVIHTSSIPPSIYRLVAAAVASIVILQELRILSV